MAFLLLSSMHLHPSFLLCLPFFFFFLMLMFTEWVQLCNISSVCISTHSACMHFYEMLDGTALTELFHNSSLLKSLPEGFKIRSLYCVTRCPEEHVCSWERMQLPLLTYAAYCTACYILSSPSSHHTRNYSVRSSLGKQQTNKHANIIIFIYIKAMPLNTRHAWK